MAKFSANCDKIGIMVSRKKLIFWIIIFIFLFTVCFGYYYSDKFFPNTHINGVRVGGMTYPEAEMRIKTALDNIEIKGIDLEFIKSDRVKKINIPAYVTGFTPDTVIEYFNIGDSEEIIKRAYERGREPSFVVRWFKRIWSLFFKKTFTIPYSIQQESIFSLLERELNGFITSPQNAEFRESPEGIIIAKEKPGADMDLKKAAEEMNRALFDAKNEVLSFEVNQIAPPITAADLAPKLEFANAVAKSVNLEFRNEPYWWRAKGPILATWIAINNGGKETIVANNKKLENFVRADIIPSIEGKMANSRFEMRGGKLEEIAPGVEGFDVNFEELKADVETELRRIYSDYQENKLKRESLVIPLTIEKVLPKITKETIEQYKIKDLVGRAKTSFAGSSAARINNIKIGVSKLNGILIAPGEEFSAVEAIGKVDEEAGYKKEFVIKLDKSVEEFGGGLCQIATTLFRLALDAGLSVTERQNHSYVVGYYGPGLDATIYGPHPDLRFVNDTENYILLQGMVESSNLIFELYGKKDGRMVSISEPRIRDKISPPDTKYILSPDLPLAYKKCTERRREGLTAEADYRVEYADSSVHEQTFVSEYKPWQEVCLFGTRF